MNRKKISYKFKIFAVLLALIVAASALAACSVLSSNAGDTQDSMSANNGSNAGITEIAGETTELADPTLTFSHANGTYDGEVHDGFVSVSGAPSTVFELKVTGAFTDGTDMGGEGITCGSGTDFSVTNAGNYTVYIKIASGQPYDWTNKSNVDGEGYKTAGTFTIKQATLDRTNTTFMFAEDALWEDAGFNYGEWSPADGALSMTYKPNLRDFAGSLYYFAPFFNDVDMSKVGVEIGFYSVLSLTGRTPIEGALQAGTVHVKGESLYGIDGDNTYRNFVLATGFGTMFKDSFTVNKVNLTPVQLYDTNFTENIFKDFKPLIDRNKQTVTATYLSEDYPISKFFENEDWAGLGSGEYISITVDGTEVTGDYILRNVKRSASGAVEPYQIKFSVKDKANYAWSYGDDVTYALTIKPHTMGTPFIVWQDQEYTGNKISFKDSYTLKRYNYSTGEYGVFGDDEVSLIVDDTRYADAVFKKDEDGKPTNVVDYYPDIVNGGSYRVYVTGLAGKDADNYTLPELVFGDEDPDLAQENITSKIGLKAVCRVTKKALQIPSGTIVGGSASVTFDGERIIIDVYDVLEQMGLVKKDDNGKITSVFIASIFADGQLLDVSTAFLGRYEGDGSTPERVIFLTSRAGRFTAKLTFTSNAQTNYRWEGTDNATVEWTDFAVVNRAEVKAPVLGGYVYRTDTLPSNADNPTEIKTALEQFIQNNGLGKFLEIVGFGKAGQTSVDSVIADPSQYADPRAFDCLGGKYVQGEYFAVIRLIYGINSSYFAAGDAHFTDLGNGYATVSYSVRDNLLNVGFTVNGYIYGQNPEFDSVFTLNDPDNLTSGAPVYTIYTSYNGGVLGGELAEGTLPTDAGTYYVKMRVGLKDGDQWTNSDPTLLVVAPRAVTLSWTVDGGTVVGGSANVKYNGNAHTVSASVTNALSGDTVTVTLDKISFTNAGEYAVNVTLSNPNYTLDGGANVSFTLTVTPVEITVSANDYILTFGTSFDISKLTKEIAGSFINASDESNIALYIYQNGVRVENLTSLPKGFYEIVPVWKDNLNVVSTSGGSYVTELDNYRFTMVIGRLSVQAHQLIVTFNDGVCAGQYGEDHAQNLRNWIASIRDENNQTVSADVLAFALEGVADMSAAPASDTAYSVIVSLSSEYNGSYTLVVTGGTAQDDGSYSVANKYKISFNQVTINVHDLLNHQFNTVISGNFADFFDIIEGTIGISDLDSIGIIAISKTMKNSRYSIADPGKIEVGEDHVLGLRFKLKSGGTYFPSSPNYIEARYVTVSDNKLSYSFTRGNYRFTVNAGRLKVIAATLNITFTDGEINYGQLVQMYAAKASNINPIDTPEEYRKCLEYKLFTLAEIARGDNGLLCGDNGSAVDNPAVRRIVTFKFINKQTKEEYEWAEDLVLPAGEYEIRAVQGTYPNFVIPTDNPTGTLVVKPLELHCTVSSSVASVVYGSGLTSNPFTFTYVPQGDDDVEPADITALITGCIVDKAGNKYTWDQVFLQNAGEYTVGFVCENTNYIVVCDNTVNFTIQKRAITVTPSQVGKHVYGNVLDNSELNYDVTSVSGDVFVNGDSFEFTLAIYNGVTDITATLNTANVKGSYTIGVTFTAQGDTNADNYDITVADNVKFAVVPRPITVTADDITHSYGTELADGELTSKITTSLGEGIDAIVNGDENRLNISLAVYMQDGTTPAANIAALSVGEYVIKVNYTGNDNYDVTVADAKFIVDQLTVRIRYGYDLTSIYGDSIDVSKLYTIEGLLAADVGKEVVTVTLNGAVTTLNSTSSVGTYRLKVTVSPNYDVEYVGWTNEEDCSADYVISQRSVTIKANDVTNHVYGNALGANAFGYEVQDGTVVNNDVLNASFDVYTKDGSNKITDSIASQSIGEYVIKVTVNNANYNVTTANGTFTVVKRAITITANNVTDHVYGDSFTGTLGYTVTSGQQIVNGDEAKLNIILGIYETAESSAEAVAAKLGVGAYVVKVSAANANYDISLVNGTFTVKQRDITVASNSVTGYVYGSAAPALGYTVVNGTVVNGDKLNLTVNVYNGGNIVANADIYKLNAGTYAIKVAKGSNPNYNITVDETNDSQKFAVANADITITNKGTDQSWKNAVETYTGAAFSIANVNDYVTVTTVNAQNVTITYKVDGGTAVSVLPSFTDAGKRSITVTVSADNHNPQTIALTHEIKQAILTLKADDKSVTYGDNLSDITFSVSLSGTTALTEQTKQKYLTAANAQVNFAVNGYSSVTAAGTTFNIINGYTGDGNVKVAVSSGVLTVEKRTVNVSYTEGLFSTYGDVLEENVLNTLYTVSGLVNGDSVTVTAKTIKNGSAYNLTDANAPAGDYVVTVTASGNYQIEFDGNKQTGAYTVKQLTISVTSNESAEFVPDDSVLSGAYGQNVFAQLTFVTGVSGLTVSQSDYGVIYDLHGTAEETDVSPNRAGRYTVKVSLKADGNYVLDNGGYTAELQYEITKYKINSSSVNWTKKSVSLADGEEDGINVLRYYHNAIMYVDSFTRMLTNNSASENISSSDYYFDENGQLCINVKSVNNNYLYSVTFAIKDDAAVNFEFVDADVNGIVRRDFTVNSNTITTAVLQQGWQYTDERPQIKFTILVGEDKKEYTVKDTDLLEYRFAVVKPDRYERALQLIKDKTANGSVDLDLTEIADLYDEDTFLPLSSYGTFDVGIFIVCISYSGAITDGEGHEELMAIRGCDVFEVSKKQLKAPTVDSELVYNGMAQTPTINYVVNGLDLSKLVTTSVTPQINVCQTAYTVKFTIIDTDHYVWETAVSPDTETEKSLTWIITSDTADNSANKYFTLTEISSVTYGTAVTLPTLTAIFGYEGTFTWYFAAKGGLTDAAQVGDTDWSAVKPKNAGDYFVKVVLSDSSGYGNFSDKVSYGDLTINKAQLTLTPSGNLIYGQAFGNDKCEYTLDGFKYNDNQQNITVAGTITYSVVGQADVTKLPCNKDNYALSAVINLTADNYTIILAAGYGNTFAVTPLAVNVTIGNAASEYGAAVDLSKVAVTTDNALATSEVAPNISFAKGTLTTTASADSDTGIYSIQTAYVNDNFDITYTFGSYEITQRIVNVALNKNAYSYVYGSAEGASITNVTGSDGADITSFIADKLTLSVVYSGKANNNTTVTDDVHYPKLAGGYTVTVTAVAKGAYNLDNFKFNVPTVNYEVTKFTVNVGNITAQPTIYTGGPRTPEITDVNTYAYGQTEIYTVNYNLTDLVAAGEHNLTLEFTEEHGCNYEWDVPVTAATATITFVIQEASVFAIPEGELTYGNNFENAQFSVKYVDSNGNAISGVNGTVTYVLVGYDNVTSDTVNSSLRLTVGSYGLTLAVDAQGFVQGVSLNNYKISLKYDQGSVVNGTLNVVRRKLILQAADSQSVYGQDVIANQTYTLAADGGSANDSGLAYNDVLADVVKNYIAAVNAVKGDSVGDNYVVSATADSDNYVITVKEGTHKITQLHVNANVSAQNGVYKDANKPVVISINGISVTLPDIYDFPADFANQFIVKITGTANDGTRFNEQGSLLTLNKPVSAGKYTVEIIGITDGNFKYNGGDASVEFTVDKANVTLTPYGTLTYGQEFNQGVFGYRFDGFKDGDGDSAVSGQLSNESYLLKDSRLNADRLNANAEGYALTVAVNGDGYADGLTAYNYNITVADGLLKVAKRTITIKPTDVNAVYSQPVAESTDFDVIGQGFAFDDDKSVINYRATVKATQNSAVGKYDIVIDGSTSADNYEVIFQKGVYNVAKAKVAVTIHALIVHYGDNVPSLVEIVNVEVVDKEQLNLGVSDAEINSLKFIISYSGTPNGSASSLPSSTRVPEYAGRYIAHVDGVENNGNFEVDYSNGLYTTVADILRKEVDSSKITVKSEAYTGKEIRNPVIIDETYNINGYQIYTASHTGHFITVGTYSVTLTLVDTDNYCWLNNLNSTAEVRFEITKADNYLVDETGSAGGTNPPKVQISDWTFGDEASRPQAHVAGGSSANIVFEYATSQYGSYTTEAPKNAGTYWVRATMAANDNYNAFVSEAVSFTIAKRVVVSPTFSKTSEENTYTGALIYAQLNNYDGILMRLDYNGMNRINNDGTAILSALDAGVYTAVITLADVNNYVWADGVQLTNNAVTFSWEIKPQVVAKPTQGNQKLYAGGNVEFIPEGFNSGIMEIEGNVHSGSGSGTAVISLKDTKNYVWEDGTTGYVTVTYNVGINVVFIAVIGVAAGLSVGLAVMAVILTIVHRRKRRNEQEAMDARSRADGWNN